MTEQIYIYDMNNFVNRMIDTDITGETPRTLLYRFLNPLHKTFLVWDAENSLKARRAIFPNYKVKTSQVKEDTFVAFDLIYDVLKFSHAMQVKVEGYEADDIIACMARSYASQGVKVHIVSTDRDFLQLINEYPTLISADCVLKEGVMLSDIRYHKTLVGDPSDKIPGMKGFGEKKWDQEYVPDIKVWFDLLVAGEEPGPFAWGGKACETWAADPENRKMLLSFWEIIGFLPMTVEQVAENLVIGNGDANAGNLFLQERMQ